MLAIKKIVSYLLCLFFISILSINYVHAITFKANGMISFSESTFSTNCSDDCHTTFRKTTSDGKKRVYCGAKERSYVYGSSAHYIKDSEWAKNNKCKYKYKNGKKYKTGTGKCSEILGFIIKAAGGGGTSKESDEITMKTQAAIWTYLAAFSPSPFSDDNATPAGGWDSVSVIKKILYKAWANYSNYRKKNGSVDTEVEEPGMFSVSGPATLYYVPQNACSSGYYKSNNIVVKNNKDRKIYVEVNGSIGAIELCADGKCYKGSSDSGILSFSVDANQSKEFYLKSVSLPRIKENLEIEISASYEVSDTTKPKKGYSSVRYVYKDPATRNNYQSVYMIKSVKQPAENLIIEHYDDKTIGVNFNEIKHRKCSVNGIVGANGVIYYGASSQTNKVCKNNTPNEKAKDSMASFSACSCRVEEINGKKVGIIVNETVKFYYGTFAPSYVYPGGGFAFSDSSSNNGTPTTYSSEVRWDYADYYPSDGKPYYYDGTRGVVLGSDVTDKIVNVLRNKYNNPIKLKISTLKSNVGTANNAMSDTHEIPFNVENVTYDSRNKIFNGKIDSIKMNPSYLSTDGVVSYTASSNSINGGNKYYVPLKYMNDSTKEFENFPFNITNTNLSLTGYFEFIYAAKCYEKVLKYDLKSNLKYRPISESTPFPKSIPVNWIDWYNLRSNQDRLTNSFRADKLLYSITLNANNVSEIQKYNNSYTNWDYVSSNGVDKVVTEKFSKKANSSSYCPIGKFDASCDK